MFTVACHERKLRRKKEKCARTKKCGARESLLLCVSKLKSALASLCSCLTSGNYGIVNCEMFTVCRKRYVRRNNTLLVSYTEYRYGKESAPSRT